jgi:hypothetical protein
VGDFDWGTHRKRCGVPWFPSENDRENAGFSTSMLVYRRVSSKNGHLPVIQNNQEQCQFFSVIAMQGPMFHSYVKLSDDT